MMKRIILVSLLIVVSLVGRANDFPKSSDSTNSVTAGLVDELQQFAQNLIGTRYKWGGRAEKGFDCSGLVNYVFANFGMQVAHGSRELYKLGCKTTLDEAMPGDLIFFKTSSKKGVVTHVGIVLEPDENGLRFIHSAQSQGVIISYMKEKYYSKRFVGVRRVLYTLLEGKS